MNVLKIIAVFIKTHRRLIILCCGILLIFFIVLPKKKTIRPTPDPASQQKKQSFTDLSQDSPTNNEQASFFINKVFTKKPVTGYSWLNQDLIYSTPEGIFVNSANESLFQQPINYISWSQNGSAVFQSQNQWQFFNGSDKKIQPLNLSGSKPIISPDANYLASINNQSVQILNLKSLQTTQIIDLNDSVIQLSWSHVLNNLVGNSADQVYLINLVNLNVKKIRNRSFGQFKAISPNGDYLIYSNQETIKIITVDSEKETSSIKFEPGSDLTPLWLDHDWLMVMETAAPDALGRRIDYLWKIINFQDKQIITNSMPIANRLNNTIPLYLNPDKNILPLAENNDSLWILSLTPNQFPSYTQTGFSFLSLPASED